MSARLPHASALSARPRSAAKTSGRAFVVESLVLLAFLAASVAIVLQVFAAAGQVSRDAHTLSMAQHLAVNAAESFGARPQEAQGVAYYTSAGELLPGRSTASFAVETHVESQPRGAGVLYEAEISVSSFRGRDEGNRAYLLRTKRYISGDEGMTEAQGAQG